MTMQLARFTVAYWCVLLAALLPYACVCSTMRRSAGVSTTHSLPRSRCGSRQVAQISSSVNVWQRLQWRTCDAACASACASSCAPARSCCRRWKAIRDADFTPTPGKRRSASISALRALALKRETSSRRAAPACPR